MWFNDDDDYEDAVEPAPVSGLPVSGLHTAAAVSDLEQIGQCRERRGWVVGDEGRQGLGSKFVLGSLELSVWCPLWSWLVPTL